MWDDDHRQDTLLAISAGMLSGRDFADGMGRAAQGLLAQRQALREEGRSALGGPDDAFEIFTDPQTGQRSYRPVEAFTGYMKDKREAMKPTDIAGFTSRYVEQLAQLAPEDRSQALADMRAHPEAYPGLDPRFLPVEWNDAQAGILGGIGMTAAQARKDHRAGVEADRKEAHRNAAADDRAERTRIMRERAGTAASQGSARIGIAREALGLRKAGTGGKGGSKWTPASQQSNADLLSFIRGN
ncbi:hypothetical protein [Sphingobium sp.]|uniref:hypothetical protein n=1 Tax=Sphingobium sp. TaxID=1912891 RepID=UPI002C896B78|nr:hypothetical protein [Sphingobium sp.]HUD91615.1 hypothetical protein [Sphingobium sp.]